MQTDVYIKVINEKMNIKFWMAGFLVIPKIYAVIASPFSSGANETHPVSTIRINDNMESVC